MTYRNETEMLQARVSELEKKLLAAEEALERSAENVVALQRYTRPSLLTLIASGLAGAAIGIMAVLIGNWALSGPPASPPEPSALVIHNAWCYRAHNLFYGAHALSWTTQAGTRLDASYENVTVVIPRDTSEVAWDAAYRDALIESPGDCD